MGFGKKLDAQPDRGRVPVAARGRMIGFFTGMETDFRSSIRGDRLHARVTAVLARQVIEAERSNTVVVFPKEADLCRQLGVSRTVLRESMKVLADKGMIEMKPRVGTRARPRSEWRLLDPDILAWQAEAYPDPRFLQDLCEVRLAIEPTAAGYAAVRASEEELERIAECLRRREAQAGVANLDELIDLDLAFHAEVVNASHNPLLKQLSANIRQPFRTALSYTSRFRANVELGLEAHRELLARLKERDPVGARRAAEEVVGLAMLAVEKVARSYKNRARRGAQRRTAVTYPGAAG
jgi:GntR family galactonate operon transcriptional repressor